MSDKTTFCYDHVFVVHICDEHAFLFCGDDSLDNIRVVRHVLVVWVRLEQILLIPFEFQACKPDWNEDSTLRWNCSR